MTVPPGPAGSTLTELPEPVRLRVVSLTAEVLPEVPRLPPPVRRVADFAPQRRARLGSSAITDALGDDDFRERVGTQLAARPGGGAEDPATVAARAWLVRAEGWEDELAEGVRAVRVRPKAPDERARQELERLRGRLTDAEQALREQRAAHRAQLDQVKAENAVLRRKLGDTRAAEKEARAATDRARAEAADALAAATERAAALDRENRRLRGQLDRWEEESGRARRDGRTEREEATLRARMLLDTVLDAAAGLRRELALPAAPATPGERAEDRLGGARTAAATTASATSPAVLEQLLTMPRSRLLVDGYNVSKSAWPASALDAQRTRLVTALAPLVARTGAETTVVFDAAESDHRPPVNAPRGVRVLFSPRGVIADDVLRDLVAAEPEGRVVVLVTADQAVARDVAREGARVVPPDVLLDLLSR